MVAVFNLVLLLREKGHGLVLKGLIHVKLYRIWTSEKWHWTGGRSGRCHWCQKQVLDEETGHFMFDYHIAEENSPDNSSRLFRLV